MPPPIALSRTALIAVLAASRRTTISLLELLAAEVESTKDPKALAERIRFLGVCLEGENLPLAETTLWKLLGL